MARRQPRPRITSEEREAISVYLGLLRNTDRKDPAAMQAIEDQLTPQQRALLDAVMKKLRIQ
jgi:hypothetical protein